MREWWAFVPATPVAVENMTLRTTIASVVCVIAGLAAVGCGGGADSTSGVTSLPRTSVAKAPRPSSSAVSTTKTVPKRAAPVAKRAATRAKTRAAHAAHRSRSRSESTRSRPAAVHRSGHAKAAPRAPSKLHARTKATPARPHRPAGTLTTAQARERVQLSCHSYRSTSSRGRGGKASLTQTLASALVTLPMTVPADLQSVRGQLVTGLQQLTKLTSSGSSSSAERQAAAMLPSIDKYASALGVSPCTA